MEQKKVNPIKKFVTARGVGQVLTVMVGLVILCLIFYIINPNFLGSRNVPNLLRQIAPYIIIGIGQGFVLITANIDLSIGSIVGMVCMTVATLICNGMHPYLAIVIGMLAAMATGVVNGLLVANFKLPPFVGTLGTMTICRGVAQMVNNNMNTDSIEGSELYSSIAKGFRQIYSGNVNVFGFKVYYPIIIALIIWAFFNFLLAYTRTGRHLYAIGSNVDASKLSGVNVNFTTMKAYLVSAFCSGVVGLIVCAQTGTGTMNSGNAYETYAVAAAVIGGISTMGGSGILSGVLVGASVWAAMDNGLQLIGTSVGLKNVVVGCIVIVCVLLDVVRRTGKFRKKPV